MGIVYGLDLLKAVAVGNGKKSVYLLGYLSGMQF